MSYAGVILMGALDLLAGTLLVTAQRVYGVQLVIYEVPFSIAFYIGIALLVKGIYSLAFLLYGGS